MSLEADVYDGTYRTGESDSFKALVPSNERGATIRLTAIHTEEEEEAYTRIVDFIVSEIEHLSVAPEPMVW